MGEIDLHQLAIGRGEAFDQRRVEVRSLACVPPSPVVTNNFRVVAARAKVNLVHRVEHVFQVRVLQQPSLQRGRAADDAVLVQPVVAGVLVTM